MHNTTEQVLAVPTGLLRPYLTQRGLISENIEAIMELILKHHRFLPRPEAEKEPDWRQIIPYVVLCRGDEVFATQRLRGGTEARLHGLLSLGIGGHINPDTDGDGPDVLMRGLSREIREEVAVQQLDLSALRFRGFINDDTNEVGKVHLGLFCTLDVTGEVQVRETKKLTGRWLYRRELSALSERMETWSALILNELDQPSNLS